MAGLLVALWRLFSPGVSRALCFVAAAPCASLAPDRRKWLNWMILNQILLIVIIIHYHCIIIVKWWYWCQIILIMILSTCIIIVKWCQHLYLLSKRRWNPHCCWSENWMSDPSDLGWIQGIGWSRWLWLTGLAMVKPWPIYRNRW